MYTTEQGYKITIFNTARNKQYIFKFLSNQEYIKNELEDLGFSANDIKAATYTVLTPVELKQHIEEIEGAWDNY